MPCGSPAADPPGGRRANVRNYALVMATPRRLTRSRSNRRIAGVCGGLAEYFGWDPTLVRVAYVVASIVSVAFPGMIVYLVLWLLMPDGD